MKRCLLLYVVICFAFITQKLVAQNYQVGFSEFTATDSAATLATGLRLPDLIIAPDPTNTGTLAAGTNLQLRMVIVNWSNFSTAAPKVNIYLSPDTVLTPGVNNDLLVGFGVTPQPATGGSSFMHGQVISIPCAVTPGTYTLFYVIDPGNELEESDETNNVAKGTLTVTTCVPTGIEEIEGLESFELAPNPTTGLVMVKLQLNRIKTVSFHVIDNAGRTVYRVNAGNRIGQVTQPIDLRRQLGTIYYLQTMIGHETFMTKVLVIRN